MKKPECKLTGENGNIFHLINVACDTLTKAGLIKKSVKLKLEALKAKDYNQALQIISKYVDVS